MIDKNAAKKHIRKLSGQPFAPASEEAWSVLIDAMRDYAENEAHAAEIIDECLRLTDMNGMPRMATVHDIRLIAVSTRKTELRPDRSCQRCHGTGFVSADDGGAGTARRCDCRRRQAVEDQPVYGDRQTIAAGERQ